MSLTTVKEPQEITLDYIDYIVTKGMQMKLVDKSVITRWRKELEEM